LNANDILATPNYFIFKVLKMKKIIMIMCFLFVSNMAAAACIRADMTGTWIIYTMFDRVGRCTVFFPATGNTISTNSVCQIPGVGNVPIRGTLNIRSSCQITGSTNIGGQARNIDAWLSKDKNDISGMGWNGAIGFVFSGVKL